MKRKKLFSAIAAALLLVPLSLAQAAINPASVQELAAADGRPFGSSMSLSADGGTGLVGTWDSGAVYAYGSTAAPQPARKP